MASEQNSNRHLATLRTHLPRAGFRWPARATVLARKRQDEIVLNALRDHGGATLLRAGTRTRSRHVLDQVEQILADMFHLATDNANSGRIDAFSWPLDWVEDLRGQIRWAQAVEEDTFTELFVRLRQGRREWQGNPCEPFDVDEHGVLAHALDHFHRAASDDLVKTVDEWFLMTQDHTSSVGEERVGNDPAAAAPHTQGMGAHAAAGEPHPQTPSASGGAGEDEDEDGDVQMNDGEEGEEEDSEDGRVREVRLQLAATDLGEMELDE